MKQLTLLALALVAVLTACQSPLPVTGGKTVTIHLPASTARGGGLMDTALTAYPDALLATLDHFVVKITDGTTSLVPDQTVPANTTTVTFTGVPAGTHRLQLEAWTATALTAVGDVPLQVADDATATVGPAVLAPVEGTGNGQFDLVLTVGPQLQTLLTAGSVTTRLRPLVYQTGGVDTAGPPLAAGTVTLTQPAGSLRLQATSLPSGNYLLELLAPGYDLPLASPVTIATLVVQVYADQTAVLPSGSTLSISLAESSTAPPHGLRVDLADAGTKTLSWDVPLGNFATAYQVGYSLDTQATQPDAVLALTGGLDANSLVPGANLHPVGDRFQVGLDLLAAPWPAALPFRVFARALQGSAVASPWTIVEVAGSPPPSDLLLGHLAFSGLAPGASYRLQRTNSTGSEVLEERSFVTGTLTEEAPFDFPGFVVHAGEKLNLVRIVNNVSELAPLDITLLPPTTPGMYPPSTVFRAYFGYTSDDIFHNNKGYYLTTDDLAAPAGLVTTSSTLNWDRTNGGQAWPNLFGVAASAWSVDTSLNPVPDSPWNLTFPGSGSPVAFSGKWSPPPGKVTNYRLRVGYDLDRNGDTVPDLTVYGPASAWVQVDKKAPEILATLTNGSVFDVTTTNNIQLSVAADEDLGDYGVSLLNNDGSVALPANMIAYYETFPDARHYQWSTDWTLATGPQLTAWSQLPPGRYYLAVGIYDMGLNGKTYYVAIDLVGGPN